MTVIKSKHQLTDEEYEAWLEYMTSQCYRIMDNGEYIPISSNPEECYPCATQRHKCEHDDIDWEEYQKGKSWEDEAPRKEEFEDGI